MILWRNIINQEDITEDGRRKKEKGARKNMLCSGVCKNEKAFAKGKCWKCWVKTELTEEQAKQIVEKLRNPFTE